MNEFRVEAVREWYPGHYDHDHYEPRTHVWCFHGDGRAERLDIGGLYHLGPRLDFPTPVEFSANRLTDWTLPDMRIETLHLSKWMVPYLHDRECYVECLIYSPRDPATIQRAVEARAEKGGKKRG